MSDLRKLPMLITVVVLTAWAAGVSAQGTTTGSIAGTMTDSSGAVLPGVTMSLTGPNLQGTRTTTTDGEGFYRFRNVPPGTNYRVVATLSGFRDAAQAGVQVFLGQEGSINLTMSPPGVAEAVTVTAAAPLVDVAQTSTGVNITADLFSTLPSFRGFQGLTTLAPSVTLEM